MDSKWFKIGCFGCLGIVALVVLVVAALGGLAWQRSRSVSMEDQVTTRDLPGPAAMDEAVSPEDLAADVPGGAAHLGGPVPGRVILELSAAEFIIKPAAEGEPIRVEGRFDSKSYELVEQYSEADGGGWEYRVQFRRTAGSWLITTISEMIAGARPEVTIFLPPDHPMALDLEMERGGLQAELGGLWITAADVEMAMGGMAIKFDEPLREPMESLAINGRMGGAAIAGVGNASPGRLELDYSMGGLSFDMRGKWVRDAEISLKTDRGGVAVRLPRGVNFEGLPPEVEEPEPAGSEAPTLRFRVTKGSGDLEFSW